MTTGIVVVTHDGRMPRNGGRRLGYMVGEKLVPIPGIAMHLYVPPPKPVIVYANLEAPKPPYGGWQKCGKWNLDSIYMNTDEGERRLMVCSNCDHVMKPRWA